MIKLTEGGFSEMWNGRKSPEIEALSYAIRMQAVRIIAASDKTSCYAGVDELPEEILDYFAQELRALYYDETASIGRKRTIIKNTMPWYERNGTAGALIGMLSAAFDSAAVEEWYEYSGEPYHFNVVLATEWDEGIEASAREAIEKSKNVRSVLDNLIFRVESSEANAKIGSAVSGIEIVETSDVLQKVSVAVDKMGTAVSGIEVVTGWTV